MQRPWLLLAALLCAAPGLASADEPAGAATAKSSARGMDFDVYIRLRKGMTEGELLERAGPPDHQTFDSSVVNKEVVRQSDQASARSTESIVKSYYYFPTAANPFTTVVTTTGGRVTDLKRERKF